MRYQQICFVRATLYRIIRHSSVAHDGALDELTREPVPDVTGGTVWVPGDVTIRPYGSKKQKKEGDLF
jgi:hypothetical protein